mgnify:CR=1 FL=1
MGIESLTVKRVEQACVSNRFQMKYCSEPSATPGGVLQGKRSVGDRDIVHLKAFSGILYPHGGLFLFRQP